MKTRIIVVIICICCIAAVGGLYSFFTATPDYVPLSGEQLNYVGKWNADDKNIIVIREDGSDDYRAYDYSGIANKSSSMDGANVKLIGNTIVFQLFTFKKIFTVEQPPYDASGKQKLKVDGTIYTKE